MHFFVIIFLLLAGCKTVAPIATPRANIGIQVRSLTSGKVLYEQNPNELFIPASTLKIFTVATALAILKPSYQFETKVYYHQGDLYLQGSGDPEFSTHRLSDISARIKQLVKEPIQNIIVDDSVFDRNYFGLGWEDEDMGKGFAAPISGINVDYNRLVLTFLPGGKVLLEPFTKYVTLTTTKTTYELKGLGIAVQGTIPKVTRPQYKTYAIMNPPDWAGFLFKEQLQKAGVKVKGEIQEGFVPSGLTPITTSFSPYLSEMLINYTKFSRNLGNEAVLKTLGNGHFEQGLQKIEDFVGLGHRIVDGSGLSRQNAITPAQMTAFLVRVANDFQIAPEFTAALPIAGQDGTLKNVFLAESFKGKIRAKTGYMTGVKALTGYFRTKTSETVAFTVFANENKSTSHELQRWLEHILGSL
ncbi:MAG: D-alanyl-D-alanine carboxypeptidase/D-alanyl-D-alanine-endopeptidase [Myxococcota bacterium]